MEETKKNNQANIWEFHFEKCKESGLSARSYCKKHDQSYQKYCYWHRKLKKDAILPSAVKNGFLSISVPIKAAGNLTIKLPNGIELSGTEEDHLPLVARLMRIAV